MGHGADTRLQGHVRDIEMGSRITMGLGGLTVACLAVAPVAAAQSGHIPRTPSGHPDLSGTYDVSTLTPMQRPTELGEKKFLTDEEACRDRRPGAHPEHRTPAGQRPQPRRPPAGGDGSQGASGNVGGYNSFWIDRGSGAFQIDGQWRTSILIDPANGRYPPPSAARSAARGGCRGEWRIPPTSERRHRVLARGWARRVRSV